MASPGSALSGSLVKGAAAGWEGPSNLNDGVRERDHLAHLRYAAVVLQWHHPLIPSTHSFSHLISPSG